MNSATSTATINIWSISMTAFKLSIAAGTACLLLAGCATAQKKTEVQTDALKQGYQRGTGDAAWRTYWEIQDRQKKDEYER